ncbi:MAG: pyridoxal phosphate-dependent aminotransferase [Planctomycetia bacterium]
MAPPHADPSPGTCTHGGASFDAVGSEFDRLERRRDVINADVLDAWFDPAPAVVEALREHLPWLLRTSPPTHAEGLVRVIARERGVPPQSVLTAGGSSELIYLALPRWVSPGARVLLVDPSYGEYEHLLGRVLGAQVQHLALRREEGWRLDPARLGRALAEQQPDLLVLVNPSSPTGLHVEAGALRALFASLPARTRVWVDETYVDFAGPGASLEPLAAQHPRVAVSKSMSKAYALSGVRAAYMVAAPEVLAPLRPFLPPWSVGLLAQVAAVRALEDRSWYAARWADTHRLRGELACGLTGLGWRVTPSVTNFLLAELPEGAPEAPAACAALAARGLWIRDLSTLGTALGRRAVRLAVKDAATQARMLALLGEVLGAGRAPAGSGPA